MQDPKEIVSSSYDAVAADYAALEDPAQPWPRLRRLQELLKLVPAGAAVLDAGCGNGVPILREMAQAHRAVGIDISTSQTDLARDNVPDALVLTGDLASAEFRDRAFAAVTAFYTIEHIPREEHAELFETFARWLVPGGHLLFTIETEEHAGDVGEWLGQPMFFSQFGVDETLELVRNAGFEILSCDSETQLEGGKSVSYAWVLTRRD